MSCVIDPCYACSGVVHGADFMYLFRADEARGDGIDSKALEFMSVTTPLDKRVVALMGTLWANFAKSG